VRTSSVVTEHIFAPSVAPVLLERAVGDAVRTPQHVALGSIRAIYGDNVAAAGRKVRSPTLYIAASTNRHTQETIQRVVPGAAFAQVVDSGHFAQLEVPGQVNAMLRRFARGL
jgi:pimeloyl-ACP methyl ester carboxylesterase